MDFGSTGRTKGWLLTTAISVLALVGSACGGSDEASQTADAIRFDCDVHRAICQASLDGKRITLDIQPKPVTAMKDLTFTLTLEDEPVGEVPYIDLNMVAMDMGPNRVDLERVADGTYRGTGVIVRCPSGKREWKAVVTVPGAGAVEFVFNVVY